MSYVETERCPHCGALNKIDHDFCDDGFNEDELYRWDCVECEKPFGYTLYMHFSCSVQAVKCFETDECEYKETGRQEVGKRHFRWLRCIHCDNHKTEVINVSEESEGRDD